MGTEGFSRTLTSAWIETLFIVAIQTMTSCRTLTSAWIETLRRSAVKWAMSGRTLTSAWIETFHHFRVAGIGDVALSRVRGLKRFRRPYP